jgi:hypothetical protein
MPNRYNWMADTDEKAFEALIEIQRRIPPGDKLAYALRHSGMLMNLARQGVRRMYPDASEREVFLREAARRLDRETMIRAYGWDPEAHA